MQETLRKAMFHVAWSPDTLPTNEAVEPLFDYLHTHLQALNLALLPQNFHKVLYEVRKAVKPCLWSKITELNTQMKRKCFAVTN